MNANIEKSLNLITKLDSWDIQSILGGVNFTARMAAINNVVRQLPELPEDASGVEKYTSWEQKMKEPKIREDVAPIIGIVERVTHVLDEYTDQKPSEYEDVLAFMVQRPPRRETFINDYNRRKALGMRPAMPMGTFVDMEMVTALKRHADLEAKGQAAVHLLHQIDGNDATAPEWLYEAIEAKIHQKLHERWMRAEMRRTNPKINKQERDLAEANQTLIKSVILELGGEEPSFKEDLETEDDFNAFLAKMNTPIKQ